MRNTLIGISLFFLSGCALADYIGPSETVLNEAPLMTIEQVLKTGKDDQYITVRGYIGSHTLEDKYLFKDKTGQLSVEIKPRYLDGLIVDEKTEVFLSGKLDKERWEPIELEVKRVMIAK